MRKRLLVAGVALLTVPSTLLAQEDKDVQKDNQQNKEMQQIIITRRGNKEEKTVIEVKGDKVTINGKDADDAKDVTVNVRDIRNRNMQFRNGSGNTIYFNNGQNLDLFSEDSHRAMLGVVTDDNDKGAEIQSVNKESAAEKAGLRKGDVITHMDGKKVEGPDDVTKIVRAHKPGDKIDITVSRDGKDQQMTATLGKWKGIRMNAMSMPKMYYGDGELAPAAPMTPNPPATFDFGDNFPFNVNGQPRLGLSIQDQEDGPGVKVLDVDDESAAEKAGIKEDDVIVGIDDHEVKNTDDVRRIIREDKEKGSYAFKVMRSGKTETFTVKIPKKLKTADL